MISTFTARGGINPWRNCVVEWTGTSDTWVLTDSKTAAVLFSGPEFRADLAVTPEKVYYFTITGDDGLASSTTWVSSPIATPRDLTFANLTATSASVLWQPVTGADHYELRDSATDEVLANSSSPSAELSGLEVETEYSVKVRAIIGSFASTWSQSASFTTLRTGAAVAGVYEFAPYASGTWSQINGWLPWRSLCKHGDGRLFGDGDGICYTEFYYPDEWFINGEGFQPGAFKQLDGAQIIEFSIYLRRFRDGSDPRAMLSHWFTHRRMAPGVEADSRWTAETWPPGFPIIPEPGIDSGLLLLGDSGWIDLPISWAKYMCALDAEVQVQGIVWGGVGDRYQTAAIPYGENDELNDDEDPANGTLRIVVT